MTVTNAQSKGYPVIGLYSAKAAKQFGSSIYLDRFGNEVEVTCVAANPEFIKEYCWEDTIVVSVSLDKWLRVGHPHPHDGIFPYYGHPYWYAPITTGTILPYIT